NVWKFLHLGRCYEMTKQKDKAIEVYKKALEPGGITSANRKFDTCRRLIGIFEGKKQYDQMLKYLYVLAEVIPTMENRSWKSGAKSTMRILPFAHGLNGDIEKGREILMQNLNEMLQEKNHMSISGYVNRSIIYEIYSDEITPWADKAIELFNYNVKEKSLEAQKIEDEEEKKKALKRVAGLQTNGSYVYGAKAGLLVKKDDFEGAVNIYNKILEMPDNVDYPEFSKRDKLSAKQNIAALQFKSGNNENGEEILKEILKETKSDSKKLFGLASTFFRHKVKTKESISWIEEALDLNKDERYEPMMLNLYANLLFENGDVEKAVKIGTDACEKFDSQRFKDDLEKFKAALKN
ncbi:hypothetical protein KAS50_00790, partial [bacterium]|nr:hypothetical protein [bacterium]